MWDVISASRAVWHCSWPGGTTNRRATSGYHEYRVWKRVMLAYLGSCLVFWRDEGLSPASLQNLSDVNISVKPAVTHESLRVHKSMVPTYTYFIMSEVEHFSYKFKDYFLFTFMNYLSCSLTTGEVMFIFLTYKYFLYVIGWVTLSYVLQIFFPVFHLSSVFVVFFTMENHFILWLYLSILFLKTCGFYEVLSKVFFILSL